MAAEKEKTKRKTNKVKVPADVLKFIDKLKREHSITFNVNRDGKKGMFLITSEGSSLLYDNGSWKIAGYARVGSSGRFVPVVMEFRKDEKGKTNAYIKKNVNAFGGIYRGTVLPVKVAVGRTVMDKEVKELVGKDVPVGNGVTEVMTIGKGKKAMREELATPMPREERRENITPVPSSMVESRNEQLMSREEPVTHVPEGEGLMTPIPRGMARINREAGKKAEKATKLSRQGTMDSREYYEGFAWALSIYLHNSGKSYDDLPEEVKSSMSKKTYEAYSRYFRRYGIEEGALDNIDMERMQDSLFIALIMLGTGKVGMETIANIISQKNKINDAVDIVKMLANKDNIKATKGMGGYVAYFTNVAGQLESKEGTRGIAILNKARDKRKNWGVDAVLEKIKALGESEETALAGSTPAVEEEKPKETAPKVAPKAEEEEAAKPKTAPEKKEKKEKPTKREEKKKVLSKELRESISSKVNKRTGGSVSIEYDNGEIVVNRDAVKNLLSFAIPDMLYEAYNNIGATLESMRYGSKANSLFIVASTVNEKALSPLVKIGIIKKSRNNKYYVFDLNKLGSLIAKAKDEKKRKLVITALYGLFKAVGMSKEQRKEIIEDIVAIVEKASSEGRESSINVANGIGALINNIIDNGSFIAVQVEWNKVVKVDIREMDPFSRDVAHLRVYGTNDKVERREEEAATEEVPAEVPATREEETKTVEQSEETEETTTAEEEEKATKTEEEKSETATKKTTSEGEEEKQEEDSDEDVDDSGVPPEMEGGEETSAQPTQQDTTKKEISPDPYDAASEVGTY